MSENTGRPLVNVSVAEIGLNASIAERNLQRLFQLASRWQAILLMYHARSREQDSDALTQNRDEADVFLESRISEADPNRNALVSGRCSRLKS